jgi:uncharacterized protein
MGITPDQMKKIQDFAIHMDWDVAFDGKSKGNMHLFRVNQLAKYLHEMEDGEEDIIVASAWLHDVGLVEGNLGHCFKGAKIARNFLGEQGLDYQSILRIVHCIEAHDGEIEANSIEAKVVHDADTLDKMGPLGLIRHTWKLANVDYKIYTVDELMIFIPKHLQERRDNLYLNPAIALADRFADAVRDFLKDKDNAHIVLREVCLLAKDGVPAETAIERMRKKGLLTFEFQMALDEQLLLSFLRSG